MIASLICIPYLALAGARILAALDVCSDIYWIVSEVNGSQSIYTCNAASCTNVHDSVRLALPSSTRGLVIGITVAIGPGTGIR